MSLQSLWRLTALSEGLLPRQKYRLICLVVVWCVMFVVVHLFVYMLCQGRSNAAMSLEPFV